MSKRNRAIQLGSAIIMIFMLSGCTEISTPQGQGPGTRQICAEVDTNQKEALTLEIRATAFGGPNAGHPVIGTTTVTGPFKGQKVCVEGLVGDPARQEWQVVVTSPKADSKSSGKCSGTESTAISQMVMHLSDRWM